jgi:hypothetical protein
VFAALCLGACNAQISDGHGASLAGVDAQPAPPGSDAAAPPATCASRTVYLNFEGQTLTRGASDATTNHASWLQNAQGTAPPYLDGVAGRTAAIQTIVDGVQAQLARFPIRVVTTRPATGEYVMIVFGGKAASVGSRYGAAVNTLDCGDAQHSDVAWIADAVAPPQHVINTAIGAIGFGLGLTATSDPKDCMCGWANQCQSDNTTACTLGAPVPRDPAADQLCPGVTTQDEVATLRTAFCGTP